MDEQDHRFGREGTLRAMRDELVDGRWVRIPADDDRRPPAARVAARAAGVYRRVDVTEARDERPVQVPVTVAPRGGRTAWVAEPHRRRVRMGIDT